MADTARASSNITTITDIKVVKNDRYVNAANTVQGDQRRIPQQAVLQSAIQNRFMGNLLSFSETSATPAAVADSTSLTLTATISDDSNRPIFAIPQCSVYIGIADISQISDLTQWPTNAVGGGNFPVYFNPADFGMQGGNNQVARITVRNSTGSTQQVLFVVQWKILTFPLSTTASNSAS